MILQALVDYYDRSKDLPREGWIRRGVDYELVLTPQGECIAFNAIGDVQKGKVVSTSRLVTAIGKQALKHNNSGKDANLLWDNASFVFGTGNKGAIKIASFVQTIQTWFGDIDDEGVHAVYRFCTHLQQQPGAANALVERFGYQDDFGKRDPILTFQLQGDLEGIHERPAIRFAYETALAETQGGNVVRGNCLITGHTNTPIALNETVIKGVWGGQSSGSNIISFNERAFESYGKTKRRGENAPVSRAASFAYTTALNHLLRQGSLQRMQVGDASTVCWADHASPFETAFAELFGQDAPGNPDDGTPAVQALFNAIHSGRFAQPEGDNRFHVLGLSPNAARISVRFYHCLPLRDMAGRIAQHFADVQLPPGPYDPQYPSLKHLLQAVCLPTQKQPFGDLDRLPPNLGGAVIDAILSGPNAPYPAQWLNAAVGRFRVPQKTDESKTVFFKNQRLRAAAIKACLNRSIRFRQSPEKEFLPMLDPDNHHTAYRLGRLFAVLEKIQEEASPGLNATIRDRYYGAASSTPVAVFTTLLRLKNAHLKKLVAGRAVWFEKLLGEVLAPVQDFPRQLPLPDQGRFALGYYHQRQDFFTRKSQDTAPNELQGELV